MPTYFTPHPALTRHLPLKGKARLGLPTYFPRHTFPTYLPEVPSRRTFPTWLPLQGKVAPLRRMIRKVKMKIADEAGSCRPQAPYEV